MPTEAAVNPRPASTILLLRDSAGPDGGGEIEVFMMVRHYEIDFNSGALVFPGGSIDNGDQEIIPRPELYSSGEELDAAALSFRIAAVRADRKPWLMRHGPARSRSPAVPRYARARRPS